MSRPLLSDLLRRANDLTARNVEADSAPAAPPPYAAESPLLEVLIEELGAKLPAEVARELRSGAASGQLEDWLSAGALYALVGADRGLARQFLERLAGNPRGAALSLATALACRMGPPPMPVSWLRCDILGVVLQLSVLCLFLLVRMFLLGLMTRDGDFTGLGFWSGPLPALELAFLPPPRLPAPAWFAWLGLWFGVEAVVGPRAMEFLRLLPARLRQQPAPVAWRADALYPLWALQALAMLALTLAAASAPVAPSMTFRALLSGRLEPHTAVALLLLPVMFAVTTDLGQIARLGGLSLRQATFPEG